MDPTLISAGVGLIGSLFGSKPSTPSYVKEQYDLQNALMKMGIDLYNTTDIAANDQQAVDAYGRNAMSRAMQMASNYDAKAASSGSTIFKGDTMKDRSRNQIYADQASGVSQLEANLATTRAQRKAALLPQSSGANNSNAMYLDQANQQANANNGNMIGNIAALLGKLWGPKGQSGSPMAVPSGQNTRYNDLPGYDTNQYSTPYGYSYR